ncbi:MAG: S1C family serine protease [Pirellulaceae bacterium]
MAWLAWWHALLRSVIKFMHYRLQTVVVTCSIQLLTLTVFAEDTRLGSLNGVAIGGELKVVKLYGAGGSGLDAYQSGFFISAEGHILTVWSTVLDVDEVVVVTSDGGRFSSTVVGIDPNLELAVLKSEEPPTSYFDLNKAAEGRVGQRVVALSNLYGIATGSEMASVQKGVVMARTSLNARRGAFESIYQGPVLVIDAMTNNPGAAGGALTTLDGALLGMLGKELRDSGANTWLNYAIPVSELKASVEQIMSGKSVGRTQLTRIPADRPVELNTLGVVLIPNILVKTPAFIDLVEPGSKAARAGLRSDDLILFVNSIRVSSQATLAEELKTIDRADEMTLLIQRGKELKEIVISP